MRIPLHVMRNPGSWPTNRLGIHISRVQPFVISTTHFSPPASQFGRCVPWNPCTAHIPGKGRLEAEIIVTGERVSASLGPFILQAGAVVVDLGLGLCASGGVSAPPVEAWKCFMYDFHNGGCLGGMRRVLGEELVFE